MAFFQTDLDPIYLREKHNKVTLPSPLDSKSTLPRTVPVSLTTTLLLQHFFKDPLHTERRTITADPMNRLLSFHL